MRALRGPHTIMAKVTITRTIAPECPRCGTEWPEGDYWPSLSRHDNETEICSDCGTAEAMLDYYSPEKFRTLDLLNWHNQKVVHFMLVKSYQLWNQN